MEYKMKNIIDITTKEEVKITKGDLPILVHGKDHSGASLLSITIAALFHKAGNKLCIFTAYPMAKEEFLKQVEDPENVFLIEDKKNIEKASDFQTIFVQSGNIDLFIKTIYNLQDINERIIFVKNIETIDVSIFDLINQYSFMVSGDLILNLINKDFIYFNYSTKILFSPISNEKILLLEKYQALLKNKLEEKIVSII